MVFNSIEDVKKFMQLLKEESGENSRWYKDFEWFSNVNYTTTSEYYGELLDFINDLIKKGEMKKYHTYFQELSGSISKIFC